MVDIGLLRTAMKSSGLKNTVIAERAGINRVTFQNRLSGIGQFTVDEVDGITRALKLSKPSRDAIFFAKQVAPNTTEV